MEAFQEADWYAFDMATKIRLFNNAYARVYIPEIPAFPKRSIAWVLEPFDSFSKDWSYDGIPLPLERHVTFLDPFPERV